MQVKEVNKSQLKTNHATAIPANNHANHYNTNIVLLTLNSSSIARNAQLVKTTKSNKHFFRLLTGDEPPF